jgi:DNA-binding transcriptional LysR family regulator
MSTGLDLFRLLVFVTVVDRSGYSAAAEHLNVGQATVSFHVQALERWFGAKLLIYERRAIHLTPAGEEVYRGARAMLQESERVAQSVRDVRRGRRGRVSVGASMAFEQAYFMERVIAPFCRAHEGTHVSLRFGHSVAQAEAVDGHELDLAYVIGWQLPSGVSYERLHQAVFTFLVAPQHPLADKARVTVDDVAEAGLIAAPLDSLEWSYYGRVLRDCGLEGVDPVLEVDGVQARVLAARAGLGVLGTFYPPYTGEDAHGPLVALDMDRPPASVEVGLVSRADGSMSASAERFADWLRQVSSTTPAGARGTLRPRSSAD